MQGIVCVWHVYVNIRKKLDPEVLIITIFYNSLVPIVQQHKKTVCKDIVNKKMY